MSRQVNAAIQLLPLSGEDRYAIIDAAIKLIQDSGLKYLVCPFETVVEGPSEKVYALLQKIQDATLLNGCSELLLNVKIHAADRDLGFKDKIEKHR
jgi:uncharacterized protein YqgV (UPF0045/DUF77 family)